MGEEMKYEECRILANAKVSETAIPEIANASDLIRVGVLQTPEQAMWLRHSGVGPRYQRVGRNFIYFRGDVVEWLRSVGRLAEGGKQND